MTAAVPRLFDNPYYHTGTLVARDTINLASLLWALIILCFRDSALIALDRYIWIAEYLDENLVAVVLLLISHTQLIWQHARLPPWDPSWHWWPRRLQFGATGYALQTGWWLFVVLNSIGVSSAIRPALVALGIPIIALGFYAWLAEPRHATPAAS